MSPAKRANRQTPSSRRRTVYSSCPASHVVHDDPLTPSRAVTRPRSARGVRTKLDKGLDGRIRIHSACTLNSSYGWMHRWRGGASWIGFRSGMHRMIESTASHCISLPQSTCTIQHFQVQGRMHQDRQSLVRRHHPRKVKQSEIRKETKTARKIGMGNSLDA